MPRGRPRKVVQEPALAMPPKRRGRPRKNPIATDDGLLVKSAELIGWALGGLEREITTTRDRLTTLTAQATQLKNRLAGQVATSSGPASAQSASPAPEITRRRKRRMSAEARQRISERMKKNWAERKAK